MRPKGHARIDPNSPRAVAICDRCSFLYNHSDLTFQNDWRGDQVENLHLLVCPRCLDEMNEQLRPLILPADPVPIANPRPENYAVDEAVPPGGYQNYP